MGGQTPAAEGDSPGGRLGRLAVPALASTAVEEVPAAGTASEGPADGTGLSSLADGDGAAAAAAGDGVRPPSPPRTDRRTSAGAPRRPGPT